MCDIYESCIHYKHSLDPAVLDGVLEIRFVEEKSQKLLKRMEFLIVPDQNTAKWIKNHPTFSKGCWPLGLFALHDWLWEKKFVDVENCEIVEGGIYDPKVGKTYIKATFENFEEGIWFAPLIYIANTHIFDQLKKFYEDNPKAQTTPERIPLIIQKERIKQAEKLKGRIAEQIQNQKLISRPSSNVKVFIDESGDIGFKTIDDVYVFTPVIIRQESYSRVTNELEALLTKHWINTAPKEIHINQVPETKRQGVKRDLAKIIQKHDISVSCWVFQKRNFLKHLFRCHVTARRTEEDPLDIYWQELINDKTFNLQFNTLSTTIESVIIHLSLDFIINGISAEFVHDKKHKAWMNDALESGFKSGIFEAEKISDAFFGKKISPSIQFKTEHSENEPCLWLSDWISNEIRGWCHQQPVSPEFESIAANMTFLGFLEDGVKCSSSALGGKVEKTYPDLPRTLVRSK